MPALKSSSTKPPGRGRRTLLTADLQERICALIRQGTYDYSAAEACGIARNTFFEWLARGEDRDKQRRGDGRYISARCHRARLDPSGTPRLGTDAARVEALR